MIEKKKHSSHFWVFFCLVALFLLPLFDLFHPGLPITHDGQDHIARIANFYRNISEGTVIPRWAGNLNWGYGHPILMFLYPLPSYTASLFHYFGFSLIDSLKIVFALFYVMSGIGMYLWLKEIMGVKAGVVGSLLYVFAPYRFVDLYVRGAIGEHVAFAFVPFVLYFLTKISGEQRRRDIIGCAVSFAFLVLSHNAISLMFLPVIAFYILYLSFSSKKLKQFIFVSIFSLLLQNHS